MDRGRRWPCPVSVFCRRTTCPSCLARVVSSFSELPIRQPSQTPSLTVLSRTLAQVPAMASAHYAVNASSSASSLLDPAQPTAWDARTLGGSILALVVTLLIAEQVRPCPFTLASSTLSAPCLRVVYLCFVDRSDTGRKRATCQGQHGRFRSLASSSTR